MTYFTDHITPNTQVQSPTTGQLVSFGDLSPAEQQSYINNDQTFAGFEASQGINTTATPTTSDTSGTQTQTVLATEAPTTEQDATSNPNQVIPDDTSAIAPDFSPISIAGNQVPGQAGINADGGVSPYTGGNYDNTPVTGGGYDPSATDQQLSTGDISSAQTSAASNNGFTALHGSTTDWRLRLSLAPESNYLYNAGGAGAAGILYPLQLTNGVIFPYTPKIDTTYNADYESYNLTHTNYTGYFYKSSHVSPINVSCDFTAQSQSDADYLLAVIHFFRSVTKMFYGQDQDPVAGTPPPLCYLNGLGNYQFNNMPVLVSSFNYSLPDNVDYVRAGSSQYGGGQVSLASIRNTVPSTQGGIFNAITSRLLNSGLSGITSLFGSGSNKINSLTGLTTSGAATSAGPTNISGMPTYVPTKMNISITLLPVISRNRQATVYSTNTYASGAGIAAPQDGKGGFW